ncbi:MAG: tetratricopeptide repeat protein [Clostridiales bacterium]|nr:tetratricopeptide repeat protein [Clostridiales bacterium]
MKNKNKFYKSALKYYENGYIKKALEQCDKGIAEDLKNSSVLNLKGVLLYVQGDLNGAVTTWKINADYNDDETSKRFLSDYRKDKERDIQYNKAELLLKKREINKALEILNECAESDFNRIKVSSALALCYVKKGDYEAANKELKRVFELDRNNELAKNIQKVIKDFSGEKVKTNQSINWTKLLIVGAVVVIILASGIGIYKVANKPTDVDSNKIVENNNSNEDNNKQDTGETNDKDLVDSEAMEKAITEKDYNTLYNLINNLKDKELSDNDKEEYEKGKNVLETEGVEAIYKNAMSLYDNKKYVEAKAEFIKVYEYGKDSYIFSHAVFFLGLSSDKNNDKTEAIKYYEEYYNDFKDGSYIEEVLYSLARTYKNIDIVKSKYYANELINTYPDSIYNNENISEILG